MKFMKILGIETSCDESACSIVEDGCLVLANTVASQIDIHTKTGGVVPEIAAREHVINMLPVLDECILQSGLEWDNIDAIAVTKGPGLISSLIIGTETASVISYVKNKPLIAVQHIVGHVYSNWLEADPAPDFPILVLTVSGGHNELLLMREHNRFELLGETIDDAAGEAFDKVSRILGLGYPGGPKIAVAALNGDPNSFNFPRSMLGKDSLDFSFSGLKTAVLNEFKDFISKNNIKDDFELPEKFRSDLAASFQRAVNDALSKKVMRAFNKYPFVKEIHLAGGVSANLELRQLINDNLPEGIIFRHPVSIKYCTDNAAMIAGAGYFIFNKDKSAFSESNIVPSTSFSINY